MSNCRLKGTEGGTEIAASYGMVQENRKEEEKTEWRDVADKLDKGIKMDHGREGRRKENGGGRRRKQRRRSFQPTFG